jgi:hypothetical protein
MPEAVMSRQFNGQIATRPVDLGKFVLKMLHLELRSQANAGITADARVVLTEGEEVTDEVIISFNPSGPADRLVGAERFVGLEADAGAEHWHRCPCRRTAGREARRLGKASETASARSIGLSNETTTPFTHLI